MSLVYCEKNAKISECSNYRYTLKRIWDKNKHLVLFIMLNPSTADASEDDPTITKPLNLLDANMPWGVNNHEYIAQMAALCNKIICAWGNTSILEKMDIKYPENNHLNALKGLDTSINLYCLHKNKSGSPKHPLFVKGDRKLSLFSL